MTRIRVLRIITRLNVGGPALHASILTRDLDRQRFETRLVSGREGSSEGSMADLGRIALDPVPHVVTALRREVSPVADARALAELTRIVRAYTPDVVHTHLAKAGALGRVAARLGGARVVVHTYHGTVIEGYFGRTGSSLVTAAERILARVTDQIVALSETQRDNLVARRIAPHAKIAVIPLGLDLDQFRNTPARDEARSRLELPASARIVVLAARLVPIKDVTTFIRAVALLRARVPAILALIVGDGVERPALERLAASLDLESQVRFLGFRPDVPLLFAAADVVALTSRNEGTPVALIEAMAAGRPTVATAVGGVPAVVEDGVTGWLVRPGDPESVAAALQHVLEDASAAVRAGARATEAVRRFSAARLVDDIERLYERLVAASGSVR